MVMISVSVAGSNVQVAVSFRDLASICVLTILSQRNRFTLLTFGATWYTVSCDIDIRNWIMETFPDDENTLWVESQDQDVFHCVIEIHEKVCNFLKLKWS